MDEKLINEIDSSIYELTGLVYAIIKENREMKAEIANLRAVIMLNADEQEIQKSEEPKFKLRHFSEITPEEVYADAELENKNFCWQKIPIRARKVLKHYKIKKPSGLRDLTIKQITRIENAGPATIEAIRDLAKSYGIELRDR